MTYDPRKPRLSGDSRITRAAAIIRMDDDWSASYGENVEIADMVGLKRTTVASLRNRLRHGDRVGGGWPAWPQPEALTSRLIELERTQPGLTRKQQAEILGTTPGMVRDTAYRIRQRDRSAAPAHQSGRPTKEKAR